MEVPFDEDIDLDNDNSDSTDGYQLSTETDTKKLFDIYESYLNKSDVSDTESEPDLSFDDHFYQMVSNKIGKTPVSGRTVSRISCLADIESRTPRISRKSLAADECDQSSDDSTSEPTLPWDLNQMTDQQIVELIQNLEEEIYNKETEYPKVAANLTKDFCDKQIEFFDDWFETSENNFSNCLEKLNSNSNSEQKTLKFYEMIEKDLKQIKDNSLKMTQLLFELKVIKEISEK